MLKIPVTVITGFLGSGKTSLLNHLISSYPDKKFAIIENEFGEVNIDSELVANVKNEDIFELSNGCICCSLNDELYVVLQNLIKSDHQFNHLLIETTGIADPGSILASFITDPFIKKEFELDAVICLVDAANASNILDTEIVLTKQIAVADQILINKTDVAGREKTDALKIEIANINKFARIEECVFAKPANMNLLGSFSYDPAKVYQFVLGLEANSTANSQITHGIENMCYTSTTPMDQMKLGMWLDAFLKFNQESIYRIKGILYLEGVDKRIILQSVHTQIQATVGKTWTEDDIKESKIVIIGKSLNRKVINNNLDELLVK
ncbi:CobW family GTP-binding protein [Labilibaculum antarcticum]|uniref:GTP-binding protein n=1 Tax=Labilibaculum antarcticum TaxID=1717717 RepID=A0A1Y1CP86_9BACT|nr:GTP-binding protein [Labilibaculum antarcticum]BAX82175.1 GTP-binding protein [Labilibaculum antarcticum]